MNLKKNPKSSSFKALNNERGMVLIGVLLLLVMISVMAFTLNRQTGLQNRVAGNHLLTVRQFEGQGAAVEDGIWQLTRDPMYRTTGAGEAFTFDGMTFTRKIEDSWVTGFEDAVTIEASAPSGTAKRTAAFRYYLYDLQSIVKPTQVVVDGWGDMYVSDNDNRCVWKVNGANGAITRFAGNGTSGGSGDGGPAVEAQFERPFGLALGPSGALFISDRDNHRVRKVDLGGTITTVAGMDNQAGYGGDSGPATSARLDDPYGIYVDDDGHLFIADMSNQRIRKVDAETGIITTVAGNGSSGYSGDGGAATSARLNNPRGVFVDGDGNIFIADSENCMIRKVNASDGKINRVAGYTFFGIPSCGNLFSNQLNKPRSVNVAANGDLYIADKDNCRIRKKTTGGTYSTFVGNMFNACGYAGDGGPAYGFSTQVDKPEGLFLKSDGSMAIADTQNACIRVVDTGGNISTLTARDNPALDKPRHIALDASGNIIIADRDNHRIRKIEAGSFKVTTIAGTGTSGDSGDGWFATSAKLDKPNDVSVAPTSGNIYIADKDNNVIRRVIASTGIIERVAGVYGEDSYNGENIHRLSVHMKKPHAVLVTSALLYYSDTDHNRVRVVDWSTGLVNTVAGDGNGDYYGDGGPATSAALKKPRDICLDTAGNLFIADKDNCIIRMVDKNAGVITTVAGTPGDCDYGGDGGAATSAKLKKPHGVWVDAAGNIFIADTDNHVIRVVSALDNKIRTLAGLGSGGFNGDDRPAISAQLDKPTGIVMDSKRGGLQMYFTDRDNNRLRMLRLKKIVDLY